MEITNTSLSILLGLLIGVVGGIGFMINWHLKHIEKQVDEMIRIIKSR